MGTGMKIWILSFGSDPGYVQLSNRLCTKISKSYPDANILVYTVDDLSDHLNQLGAMFKRGYGYWIWKPYIAKKTLQLASAGDVLLYVDGRTAATGRRIAWFDDFLAGKDLDMAAWQTSNIERTWTTGDLFKLFGFEIESEEARTGQFAATVFALRANDRTIQIVNDWYRVMEQNFDLCRDEPSVMRNHDSFIENRHDQSVFSLTIKRAITQGARIMCVSKSQIKTALQPQLSAHPGRKVTISRRFKTLMFKVFR
jgi:hypothetical protein